MAAIKDYRYWVRLDFTVCGQNVNQSFTTQEDILLIQPAQGCGLSDKIISIYDDMKRHRWSQCL
jgi:hypothetical protein